MKLTNYRQKYVTGGQRASAADFGAAKYQSVENFSGSLAQLNNVLLAAERTEQIRERHSITVEANARLTNEINTIGRLPNWKDHQKAYNQAVEDITGWGEDQLDDSSSFDIWQRDFSEHVVRGNVKIKTQSLNVLKEATRAQNERDLQTLAITASQASNPVEKSMAVEYGKILLQNQLEGGMLTHTEHQKLVKDFLEEVVGADIRALIRQNPVEAVNRLQDPTDPLVSKLSAVAREIWIDRAISAYEQFLRHQDIEQRRIERQIDKAQIKLAKQLSKQADTLAAEDQLTADWLFEHRAELNPTDYRYHLETLTQTKTAFRENVTYIQLSNQAIDGEDIRELADRALLQGDISKDYREKLHDMVEQRIGQTVPWAKSTRNLINLHFGSDEILKAIPGGAQRKAEALFAWDKWIDENRETATSIEGEKKAREILQGWQWKPAVMDLFSRERLRYGPDIMTPNMDLAIIAERTIDAYQNGMINSQEFQDEVKKLKTIKEAIKNLNLYDNQPN